MTSFLLATIAAAGTVHAASAPLALSRLCEPAAGKTVDGKVPPPIIFNRFTSDGPLMRLEGRADKDNRISGIKRIAVSDDEVKHLCDSGFPVAVLDVSEAPKASKSGNRPKTFVPPLTVLPTEFSIYRSGYGFYLPWTTYGSFWVPNFMPPGHTYQVVDFTVTPTNYENSGPNSHLAVSTQTVSNSNLDHDFDGKGAIFYGGAGECGAANKTVLQSWAIQNYSDGASPPCGAYLGCSNPVFAGNAPAPWMNQPPSCGAWDAMTPERFLVGSNIWQNSVYWRCQLGGACPEFASNSVDSSTPYFRSGGAGIAFLHVGSEVAAAWNLSFTNVISHTGP